MSALSNATSHNKVQNFQSRRKSVFAETYDPEEDDGSEEKVVFPKSEEERSYLTDAVRNFLVFRTLDREEMEDIIDAMFHKKVVAGEIVIKQNEDVDHFYVIQEGTFCAVVGEPGKKQERIRTYENSGSFGELALLYNTPTATTISADTDGSLWAIDRQTFRKILLKSSFKKRKMYEGLIESVPMLNAMQPFERVNLADALVPRTAMPGERIIKQGDAADGMYFVESGTVRITVLDEDGEEVEISTIGKGGYFGELALITHSPRAASAYAVDQLKVAFLDVEAFERLLGPCMQIMKRNIDDYKGQMFKIFGDKSVMLSD